MRSILFPPRSATLLVACLAASGAATGCSLVIESQDRQCEVDEDCSGFEDAVCDTASFVCIPREAGTSSGCVGADGCFSCEPEETVEFLNACTDAECVPYDNTQIEDLLLEDGSVPPVP